MQLKGKKSVEKGLDQTHLTHVCQTLKSLVKKFFQIPREVDLVESEIEGNF